MAEEDDTVVSPWETLTVWGHSWGLKEAAKIRGCLPPTITPFSELEKADQGEYTAAVIGALISWETPLNELAAEFMSTIDLADALDLQDSEEDPAKTTFLAAEKSRVDAARKSVRSDQITRRDALVKNAENSSDKNDEKSSDAESDEDDDSLEAFNFDLATPDAPPTPKTAMFESSGKVQSLYPGTTVSISQTHKLWFGKILVAAAMVQGPREDLPRLTDGEVRLAQVWFIVSGLTTKKGVNPDSTPDSVHFELTRLLDGTRCRISLGVLQKIPLYPTAAQAFAIAQNAICDMPSPSVVKDLSINNCFSHALLKDPEQQIGLRLPVSPAVLTARV